MAIAYTVIHQEVDFAVPPERVYDALMDEKKFSAFTGGVAQISPDAGGEFRLFGEMPGIRGAGGRNIELLPNRRIVQAWRAAEWPAGVYSIVRFELKPQGEGTHLAFDQAGFAPIPPTGAWTQMYWDPLAKYLDAQAHKEKAH